MAQNTAPTNNSRSPYINEEDEKIPFWLCVFPFLLCIILVIGCFLFYDNGDDKKQTGKIEMKSTNNSSDNVTENLLRSDDNVYSGSTYQFNYEKYIDEVKHLIDHSESNAHTNSTSGNSINSPKKSDFTPNTFIETDNKQAHNSETTIPTDKDINELITGHNHQAISSDIEKSNSSNVKNTLKARDILDNIEKIDALAFSSLTSDSNSSSAHAIEINTQPKIQPPGNKVSKVGIEASVNANYLIPNFSGASIAVLKSDTDKPKLNYGGGLSLLYDLNRSWAISAGASYQSYSTDFNSISVAENNTYNLLAVPIMVHKLWDQKRTTISFGGGLRYNIAYKASGTTYQPNGTVVNDPIVLTFRDEDYYSASSSIDFGLDLGIRYHLTKRFYLGTGLSSYFTNKNWLKSGLYTIKPATFHISLRFGIKL